MLAKAVVEPSDVIYAGLCLSFNSEWVCDIIVYMTGRPTEPKLKKANIFRTGIYLAFAIAGGIVLMLYLFSGSFEVKTVTLLLAAITFFVYQAFSRPFQSD